MKTPIVAFAAGALAAVTLGHAAELRVLASPRTETAVSVYSRLGKLLLPAREMLAVGEYVSGMPMRGNLLVIFDPSTGLYLWSCTTRRAPREDAGNINPSSAHRLYQLDVTIQRGGISIYADQGRLVAFGVQMGTDISIRQARARAVSLDDAENRAIREARDALSALEHDYWYGWEPVRLPKPFPLDFLMRKYTAAGGGAHCEDVTRDQEKWHLVLKGGGEGKMHITINDKREVLEMEWVK